MMRKNGDYFSAGDQATAVLILSVKSVPTTMTTRAPNVTGQHFLREVNVYVHPSSPVIHRTTNVILSVVVVVWFILNVTIATLATADGITDASAVSAQNSFNLQMMPV